MLSRDISKICVLLGDWYTTSRYTHSPNLSSSSQIDQATSGLIHSRFSNGVLDRSQGRGIKNRTRSWNSTGGSKTRKAIHIQFSKDHEVWRLQWPSSGGKDLRESNCFETITSICGWDKKKKIEGASSGCFAYWIVGDKWLWSQVTSHWYRRTRRFDLCNSAISTSR